MVSRALMVWESARSARLDHLVDAHHAVAGRGADRKWVTEEVNHALIVRLASEFQGFCRDLHDDAIDAFMNGRLAGDSAGASLVRSRFVTDRRLDAGNANWSNIVNDFSRFGVNLSEELRARYSRQSRWMTTLNQLNLARNAIAHDDRQKLAQVRQTAPLTLNTFRVWRSKINTLAASTDKVLGAYLKELNGARPW